MPVDPSDEEDKYFKALQIEQRQKLREQLEANAKDLHAKHETAKHAGTADLAVAERVKALGFDGEAAKVVDLLPLVHVAWADGAVQRGERAAIFKILARRGIDPDGPGARVIATLLEEKPSATYMEESLAVLRELAGGFNDRASEIVDLCIEVAAASGGFFGFGKKIGDEEKQLIDEIVHSFSHEAAERVRDGLLRSDD